MGHQTSHGQTLKGTVHAIFYYSIRHACYSGFHPFRTRSRGALADYLYCVTDLLSKIYHTSYMSRISAKGTNHYAVVYAVNCRQLKDSMAGDRSMQWKMMEECFRDICNISVGYEQAKGYCRAQFSILDVSDIHEIKAIKKIGSCYSCGGPHL